MPWALIVAALAFASAAGLTVGGVYVLAGLGWALIAGAVPCLFLSVIVARGLN